MPNPLTATVAVAKSLTAAIISTFAGTYPATDTYPGADVYPGAGTTVGASSVTPKSLTGTPL